MLKHAKRKVNNFKLYDFLKCLSRQGGFCFLFKWFIFTCDLSLIIQGVDNAFGTSKFKNEKLLLEKFFWIYNCTANDLSNPLRSSVDIIVVVHNKRDINPHPSFKGETNDFNQTLSQS